MSDSLAHYLDLWHLSDPEPLAVTPTSHLYTVLYEGERVVLKCLTPYGVEERQGAAALRCYNGHGAVRLLRSTDDAHLLEYANGESVAGMARAGDDENATRIIADVLNTLHKASPEAGGTELVPLRVWFRSLFNQAGKDRESGLETIYGKAAAIADDLLSHPRDVSVLHGDIHHENIRFREGRGWLVFDPKGLIGERTFDVTNVFRNPYPADDLIFNQQRILKTAEILSETMGLEVSRILAFTFAYACLSATWYVDEGEQDKRAYDLRMAHLIEPLLSASL